MNKIDLTDKELLGFIGKQESQEIGSFDSYSDRLVHQISQDLISLILTNGVLETIPLLITVLINQDFHLNLILLIFGAMITE